MVEVDRARGGIGQAWYPSSLPPTSSGGGEWVIAGFDVAPGVGAGPRRALAALAYVHDRGNDESFSAAAIAALTVDEAGLSLEGELYRTEDLPADTSQLHDIVVGPEIGWVAVGEGFFVTASSSASAPRRHDALEISALNVQWVADPNAPHWFFGHEGQVWRGNAFLGVRDLERVPIATGTDFRTVVPGPSGPDSFIASTTRPGLGWLEADTWTELPVWLPDEAQRCTTTRQCGRRATGESTGSRLTALTYDASRNVIVFGIEGCSAVFAFDPVAGCTTATPLKNPILYVPELDGLNPDETVRPRVMVPSAGEIWLGAILDYLDVLHFEPR